MFRTK